MLSCFQWVLDDGMVETDETVKATDTDVIQSKAPEKKPIKPIVVNLNKNQLDCAQEAVGNSIWNLLSTGHVVMNHLCHDIHGVDRIAPLLLCADPDVVCPIPQVVLVNRFEF